MQTIKVNARTGYDGVLKLELPIGVSNTEVEVVLVIHAEEKRGWPPGYFEETAGSLADDPIERPPQGGYEARDALE